MPQAAILGVMAAGAVMTASSQKQAADTEVNVANFNARQQELAGQQSRENASLQAAQVAREGRRIISAQRAAQAGTGLDIESGSALELRNVTENQNRLDQLAMIFGGQSEAHQRQAAAILQRAGGAATKKAAPLAVGGTLLSGAASTGTTANNMGMFKRGGSPNR